MYEISFLPKSPIFTIIGCLIIRTANHFDSIRLTYWSARLEIVDTTANLEVFKGTIKSNIRNTHSFQFIMAGAHFVSLPTTIWRITIVAGFKAIRTNWPCPIQFHIRTMKSRNCKQFSSARNLNALFAIAPLKIKAAWCSIIISHMGNFRSLLHYARWA